MKVHSDTVIQRCLAGLLLMVLVSGCSGGGSASLTQVSGTVTYNGQPLKQGTITYMPAGGTNSSSGEITDGTSNTFLAGERLAQECNWGGAFTINFPVSFMAQKPNSATRTKPATAASVDEYWRNCGFSSQHPAGLNMAICDGSVRFIPNTIDFTMWCRAGDKADAEVVELP